MPEEKLEEEVQTSEQIAVELAAKVADEVAEAETKEVDAQAALEKTTNERLEKTFVKGEKLDGLPEPALKEDDSTPGSDELAEESNDEDGPTAAEKKEEAKLEAEAKTKEDVDKDGADEKSVDDVDTKVKAKDEDAGKGKDEKKDVPPLSDAYYRAAIHRGWKPEEIDEQYKANPELTVRTLGNIYEAVNRTSKEFASLGRAVKEQAAVAVKPEEKLETKSEFKGLDIEQLRKEYPNEPMVDLVQTMQEQNKALFDEAQALKATRPAPATGQPSDAQVQAISQETAAIEQQIETFFRADELKGYEDFYGTVPKDVTVWDSLTPGQKMNRWTVIEMMDQMIVGARTLGRELKIDETLNLAHLSVTEPIREKVIREGIKAEVTKRGSNLTLKPSGTSQPGDTKPQTKQELEEATIERLGKVFN